MGMEWGLSMTFDELFATRIAEANAFYAAIQPTTLSDDERLVQRQAFAGMLWSKQFFHYDVTDGCVATVPIHHHRPPVAGVATASGII